MNLKKQAVVTAVTLTLVLGLMLFSNHRASAVGTNRYVANGGSDVGDCSVNPCATIQYAVNQSSAGDTINVAAGAYTENVTIPLALAGLTLKGAQAGNAVSGRTFGGVGESTVSATQTVGNSSVIMIKPSDVTIDGFSLTNVKLIVGIVSAVGSASGIDVKNTVNGAEITNNIFDGISTVDTGGNGTAQAVYLEAGPDNVQILGNAMNNIHSNRSAKGILSGDSSSTDPGTNILIQGNTISNVTSDTRGAYGIQVNNGGSTSPGHTANTGVEIRNNTISNLTGTTGWVHAVGLEANTPGVIVENNDISNLTAGSSTDRIAVWFENEDSSFSTGLVHNNNLDVTALAFGVAVHPALAGGPLDGTCNWWGSATGPTAASNPGGSGSQVSANVTYKPWLISPAPGGACIGGNVPTNKDQCKDGGWQTHVRANGTTFKNQGDCIQYVNTGK
jgi:hypothetical protein